MNGHGEKLSRAQEKAIAALLASPTLTSAAARCGIAESTLRRWMAHPRFGAEYARARRELVTSALRDLQLASIDAVGALRRATTCGVPSVEVRAATAILDLAVRAREVDEFEERLDRLESRFGASETESARW